MAKQRTSRRKERSQYLGRGNTNGNERSEKGRFDVGFFEEGTDCKMLSKVTELEPHDPRR
jgi:hypothetical protein